MKMDNIIYTIGYSGFKIEDFINTLKRYSIKCLIDVRSMPNSRYFPEYNKETLREFLKENKILYRHYPMEFGARQNDTRYYPNGYLDFDLFTKSEAFIQGQEKVEKGMELGYTFVLMCAEKDAIDCHRCIMVARKFYQVGYEVRNILDNGKYQSQKEIEKRLIEKYFPNRDQVSLLSPVYNDAELINQAYVKRNKEIGYKIEEE
ncbi:DUF488 domain-containing protein [Sporanaerobium hydrogeniformans]|uniref:DUF488 domain-containing protein n=1 Tax=Sporanaerobium hydrogeniformans TaxID=3072179 RepID=UPI0015D478C8|nr:DUF488 domain-containing protein [Sporanaerobium hydrogeniformans]